jgi:hypothetical protein
LSDVVPGQTVILLSNVDAIAHRSCFDAFLASLAEESVNHKKFRVLAFTDDAQLVARITNLNSGETFFETTFT